MFDKPGICKSVAADGVIFQPAAAAPHLQVQIKVRFGLCVNPDKAAGRVAGGFEDVQLVAYHASSNRVAADHRLRPAARSRSGAQNLGFAGGQAVVAGAELDPGCLHAALFDLPRQFAEHPVRQRLLACRVRPVWNPRLAINACRHDDRKTSGPRDSGDNIGAAAHAHRRAFDQCRHTGCGHAFEFRRHHRRHIGSLRIAPACLLNRPQVYKDMLVRQDHAQLPSGIGAERRDQVCHRCLQNSERITCAGPITHPSHQSCLAPCDSV